MDARHNPRRRRRKSSREWLPATTRHQKVNSDGRSWSAPHLLRFGATGHGPHVHANRADAIRARMWPRVASEPASEGRRSKATREAVWQIKVTPEAAIGRETGLCTDHRVA